jgi:aldehyde:ferredoxin oxidoreductase
MRKGTVPGGVLFVDLTTGRRQREAVNSSLFRSFLGGRGMNVARLWQDFPSQSEPLAPESPLLLSCGPLVGTSAPGGARFNVTARSPQTGILGDSNAGGFFGAELRFAGLGQIVIVGRAARPVYLWIDEDRVQLKDAQALWGEDVVETTAAIQEDLGDARVQVAAIGPAAERGVLFAGVFANLVRAAARTGMGTVMASKNLKAIAVRGGRDVQVAEPTRFQEWIGRLKDRLVNHPEYEIRRRLGTTQLVTKLAAMGALPTRHFQSGTFEYAKEVSGEAIERRYKIRGKACYACPVGCSRVLVVEDPRFGRLEFEGPEYEPLAGFTARVGNGDLPLALYAVDRCNRLGLDAISTSEVIAWAMELAERGLLSAREADGLDLSFGCGETILSLVEKIASREGFGNVLADGVRAAAVKLGRGQEYAMEVKGLELFQADVRAMKGYALGNAVASRGADHLRSEPWFEFSGDHAEAIRRYGTPDAADRLAWRGKGRLVAHYEEKAAVADALGVCKNIYNNMEVMDWDETAGLLSALTGWKWSGAEVRSVGERIVNLERLLNGRWGISRRDDTLPRRFLEEPAGPFDSPSAGSVVELEQMLDEYYAVRGWDADTGLPTRAKLQELRLEG